MIQGLELGLLPAETLEKENDPCSVNILVFGYSVSSGVPGLSWFCWP